MRGWMQRMGWFVLFWIASVAVLAVVALVIRSVIAPG